MKRVLCFGDSLTFGKKPMVNLTDWQRYDENTRWTSLLQKRLGDDYSVVEEGLPSRTIDMDDPSPGKEGKNGLVYLKPCLDSHVPIDILIIFLGTNDTKDQYNKTAEQIANSMSSLLSYSKKILDSYGLQTEILLVAPPKINSDTDKANKWFSSAPQKLEKLNELYAQIAIEQGMGFVSLYDKLGTPKTADGIHVDEKSNEVIADEVHKVITSLE